MTCEVGEFGLVKVPLPLTTVQVPCTWVNGSRPASDAVVPQTAWSGPAFAGVKGGVTLITYP